METSTLIENSARLPAWLDHQSALMFPTDSGTSGGKNCLVKVRPARKWSKDQECCYSIAITSYLFTVNVNAHVSFNLWWFPFHVNIQNLFFMIIFYRSGFFPCRRYKLALVPGSLNLLSTVSVCDLFDSEEHKCGRERVLVTTTTAVFISILIVALNCWNNKFIQSYLIQLEKVVKDD